MRVEVAYALTERQRIVVLELAAGATAADALAASGLLRSEPALAAAPLELSVFGRLVAPQQVLRDGDRVEVLRPLQADPKEVRRRLAAQGKSMGRRPGGGR